VAENGDALSEPRAEALLEELLSHVEYKPGWSFELRWCGSLTANTREPLLVITYPVIDVDTGKPAVASRTNTLDAVWRYVSHDEVAAWFYEMVWFGISCAEDHESKEWFKVDGVRRRNPHPRGDDQQLWR
jgi:hypothetical protein